MNTNNEVQEKKYIGIVKFFETKEFLEDFLNGELYCNTPAFYRDSGRKGVSDTKESCIFNYNSNRGDLELNSFSINGKEIELASLSKMVVKQGRKDGWLHCWAIIQSPNSNKDFTELLKDLKCIQDEHGFSYAFISFEDIKTFIKRVDGIVDKLECNIVNYYDIYYSGSSVFNKKDNYKYQREYRFVIDECDSNHITQRTFKYNSGFRDIVQKLPKEFCLG